MQPDFNPKLDGSPAGKPNGKPRQDQLRGLDIVGTPDKAVLAIYDWFEERGGRFLVDAGERPLLSFEGALYRISPHDTHFNCLMMDRIRIIHAEPGAAAVWSGLAEMCRAKGIRAGVVSWTRTDLDAGTLCIHLQDRENRILQLDGKPQVLPAGTGPALRPLECMESIEFDPAATARDAVLKLRDLVVDYLPIHPNQRWMVITWLLTAFFLDHDRWHRRKPLLKFSGPTATGKTVAIRLLSYLLYGNDRVLTGDADVLTLLARREPYLALELLTVDDHVNLPLGGFLLGVSKGEGIDSKDGPLALTAVADIDPFYRPELIRWCFEVDCSKRYHQRGFLPRRHYQNLVQERSRILSGILELFSREVVPDLRQRLDEALTRLAKEHPHHPKDHADAFLALMAVILKALFSELYEDAGRAGFEARKMFDQWVVEQGQIQQVALREVSPTVELMGHLAAVMAAGVEDVSREYLIDCEREKDSEGRTTAVRFEAGVRQLLMGLTTLAVKLGQKQPCPSPRHLAIRLEAESALLEDDGWEWGKSRVVHGEQLYSFRWEVA